MRTRPITLPAVAALLVGAALVLPGCVDGFDDPLAVEGVEADMPAWFKHPDEASTLFLREQRADTERYEDIRRMAKAGLITADETERLHVMRSQEWTRRYIEVLKGPNGPAYLAEKRRTTDPSFIPKEWSDVMSTVASAELEIERNARFLATGEWPRWPEQISRQTERRAAEITGSGEICGDLEEPQGTLTGSVALYYWSQPYQGQIQITAGGGPGDSGQPKSLSRYDAHGRIPGTS